MNKKELEDKESYQALIKKRMDKSPLFPDCVKAFFTGGIICAIGEGFRRFGHYVLNLSQDDVNAFTAIVMVFLGALLTGLGVYDRIYKFGGAGAAVPITGFSNSVVSPAMEFRREGLIMGTAARMFTIAGPVLVYGIGGSVIVGLLWLALR
ncbi:MAG: stage V sporulation protein AC [Christensenellales bacterium]